MIILGLSHSYDQKKILKILILTLNQRVYIL